jgi:hypothetical protein
MDLDVLQRVCELLGIREAASQERQTGSSREGSKRL